MKKMISFFEKFNFSDFISHALSMLQVMIETPFFIKENKLWLGLFDHKWIAFFTIIISLLFSWYLLDDIQERFFWNEVVVATPADLVAEMGMATDLLEEQGTKAARSGGSKYLLLILLEVIIFYFCAKTLSILTKEKDTLKFKKFFNAEKRMIKLMAWNFAKGIVAQVFIYTALTIVGFNELTPIAMFLVYSYFIGYAFLDNYNEQFSFKLKESQQIIRQHLGAVFSLGLVVTLLMYIPLIGPLLAPIFGGVSASIYGHRYSIHEVE